MRYTAARDDVMLSARIPRALMDRLQQYARVRRIDLRVLARRVFNEELPAIGNAVIAVVLGVFVRVNGI